MVSEHWSSALLEEWACQAMLERELGLPVSVVAAADEIVQAKGQVGFIDLFTKPLFDATASVVLCEYSWVFHYRMALTQSFSSIRRICSAG